MARVKRVVVAAAGAVWLTGCADWGTIGGTTSVSQVYSLEAVKLIAPELIQNNDPATLQQKAYDLGASRRLLLRFEKFSDHADRVNLSEGRKVILQVAVEGDASLARERLRACSLSANWMMLATWERAHPFGAGGLWARPGGDYDEATCETALEPEKEGLSTLGFDVTDWFVDYLRGRGINFGWVLVADGQVRVAGDTDSARSPRVLFERYL